MIRARRRANEIALVINDERATISASKGAIDAFTH